jgi:hypothetical protein
MTSTPVFYPLLLAALVLVCVIVHAWRPAPLRATSPPVERLLPTSVLDFSLQFR